MVVFDIGVKVLIFFTFIFFLVFFFLCSAWARPKHPERMYIIGALVSILHTFWFFIGGFLILVIISVTFEYLPKLLAPFF